MAGNQSRGLIQASKTRGWDPTIIPARDGEPENRSILPNFDKDQGNAVGQPVGSLPDGTPDGWPDNHDVLGTPNPSQGSRDFEPDPQASGNNPRRTSGANPYVGKGEF